MKKYKELNKEMKARIKEFEKQCSFKEVMKPQKELEKKLKSDMKRQRQELKEFEKQCSFKEVMKPQKELEKKSKSDIKRPQQQKKISHKYRESNNDGLLIGHLIMNNNHYLYDDYDDYDIDL